MVPLPGASSITTALSAAASLVDGAHSGAFVFEGFLPSKAGERDSAVLAIAGEPRAVVLLEAPHRIEALARALSVLGERHVTVARELTKQFEEISTMPASALEAWFAADSQHTRGEFVVVVHPAQQEATQGDDGLRVLKLLLAEVPLKTAARLAAEITGGSKNELYQAALALKDEARS